MHRDTPPVVRTQMLIRRPAADVFRAFADPAHTTRFWFTHGSGALEAGRTVRWEWAMYGVGTDVRVIDIEADRRIVVDWGEPPTRVEWQFEPRGADATMVRIVNDGFPGSHDEQVAKALDSMGGFAFVLAASKAWLEHGIELRLVADHHPDGHVA